MQVPQGMGSLLGSGRSPGGGHGNLLQYYCLETPMDRGAWWVLVHSITKGRTRLKCLSTQTFILRLYLFLLPITALCPHFSPLYNLDARLHIYSCCLTSPSNPFLPSLSTVITFKTLILIKSNFSHSSLLFPSSWGKKKKKHMQNAAGFTWMTTVLKGLSTSHREAPTVP